MTIIYVKRKVVEDGTKFSFSSVKFAEFDEIMHSDPASLKNIVSKVLTWLIRTRWRRAIWGTLSVIKCKLLFQATRFSPFCHWNAIAQRCFWRTLSASVFLYLMLNWVIGIILVMDLK